MSVTLSVLAGAGWQFFDNNGIPLAGGQIYTYVAGSSTPLSTYTDSSGGAANTNPIVLDAAGRPSYNGAPVEVWLTTGSYYKFVIKTSTGTTIATYDNLYGVSGGSAADITFNPAPPGAVATTVQAKLREYVSLTDYDTLRNAVAQGKFVKIPASTTAITVSAADSPYILPYLYLLQPEGELTLNLATGVHTTTAGNIANVGANGQINLVGVTPPETTITGIAGDITGSSGNYTVPLQVTDVSQIATGDYIKLDNVAPILMYGGDYPGFRSSPYVVANELSTVIPPINTITALRATTTATFGFSGLTQPTLSNYFTVGSLITVKGQTRTITAIDDPALTISVSSAWSIDTEASRDWHISLPNTGTVSTASALNATVTGSGTAFQTEANVGDLLMADGKMSVITAIDTNTSMVVDPPIKLSPGTVYTIVTPGLPHEGSHEVLSIVGNIVYVRNKWKGLFKPPRYKISGGDVKVIKTILQNTGTGDGVSFQQGSAINFIDNVVIKGTSPVSSAEYTFGLAVSGRRPEFPTEINTVSICSGGGGLAVVDWYVGTLVGNGGTLQTRQTHYTGNTAFGVYALEGSTVNLRQAVISGTSGRGLQVNANAAVVFTDASVAGNVGDGLRIENGGTVYAELPMFWQNQANNISTVGCSGLHINEGACGLSGASGIDASASATIQADRMLFACNLTNNLYVTSSAVISVEGMWNTGARGVTIDGVLTGGQGVYNYLGGQISARDCSISNNKAYSLYCDGAGSYVNAPYSYIRCNGTTTAQAVSAYDLANIVILASLVDVVAVGNGGVIDASIDPAALAMPTLLGVDAFNQFNTQNAAIRNDYVIGGIAYKQLAIGFVSGANTYQNYAKPITQVLTATESYNFGSVSANSSSALRSVTVTGAAVGDSVLVTISSTGTFSYDTPANMYMTGMVSAANTVQVRLVNSSTGPINLATVDYRVIVMRFGS